MPPPLYGGGVVYFVVFTVAIAPPEIGSWPEKAIEKKLYLEF
jgi:hypothetical protein